MPSPPWTTPDQDEFLESRLSDFLAAQRNKSTSDFWKQIYRDFFEKWTDPQDEIPAIIVPKKRKGKGREVEVATTISHAEWVQKRKQQIANWFNNRGNGVTHRRRQTTSVVISGPEATRRNLSEINLYSKKYYDTRVRDKAAEAWRAAQDDPLHPSRISVINKCLAQCWQDESEEIRNEIHQEYQALKEQKSQPIETPDQTDLTAESYAKGQVTMPQMIKSFLEELGKRTGFCFTLVTGGPDAYRPGRMRVLAFHEGVDRFGQKFGSAYASFSPNVMEPFQKFLYNVYSEEERAKRTVLQGQDQAENKGLGVKATNETEPPLKKQKTEKEQDTVAEVSSSPTSSSSVTTPASAQAPAVSIPPDAAVHEVSVSLTSSPSVVTPPASTQAPASAPPAPEVPISSTPTPSSAPPFVRAPAGIIPPVAPGLEVPAPSSTPTPSLTQPASELVQAPAVIPPVAPVLDVSIAPPASAQAPAPEAPPSSTPSHLTLQPAQALSAVKSTSFLQTYPIDIPSIPSANGSQFDPLGLFAMPDVPFSADELDSALHEINRQDVNEWEVPHARALGIRNHGFMDPYFYNFMGTSSNAGLFYPTAMEGPSNASYLDTAFWEPAHTNGGSVSVGPGSYYTANPLNWAASASTQTFYPPASSANVSDVTSTQPDPPTSSTNGDAHLCPSDVAHFVPPSTSLLNPTVSPSGAVSTSTHTKLNTPTPAPAEVSSVEAAETVRGPGPLGDINLNVGNRVQPTESGESVQGKSVPGDERPSRSRKPPMSKEVQPSMWLDLAQSYLVKDLEDPKWKCCIERWFDFEKQTINDLDINSRRIPAKSRPALLSKWLATRNYGTLPKIANQSAFALEWLCWWNEIQPKWRKSTSPSTLPLSVDTASGKDDLLSLKKSGPTGLVMVLIGLKWWAGTRGTDGLWESAVADILSCLEKLSSAAEPSSRKKRVS